jgi:hypothetical protein
MVAGDYERECASAKEQQLVECTNGQLLLLLLPGPAGGVGAADRTPTTMGFVTKES